MRIAQQSIKDTTSTLRESISFDYQIEIRRPGTDLDRIINWCKAECRGDWRWRLVSPSSLVESGEYQFYFDNEQDYLAFTIKWA